MKMIKLSKRLQGVADMLTPTNRCIDVGCDHGFLITYLVQSQKIRYGIGVDINKGPLEQAGKTIRRWGLEEKVDLYLSNGLSQVPDRDIEAVVIAGMGGPLILSILAQGQEKLKRANQIIVSPQSDLYTFRKELIDGGYCILEERMVLENQKYYWIMKVVWGKEEDAYTQEELYFGRNLLQLRDEILYRYLLDKEMKLEKVAQSLEKTNNEDGLTRIKEINKERKLIKKIVSNW